jgi:hypothetical protein
MPWRPMVLWDIEAPIFSRQSAHRWRWGCQPYAPTGGPLPQRQFLVLISVRGWVDPRDIVRLEGLGQLKKSNDLIGNRTRDLRLCSILSQRTTLPRVSKVSATFIKTWQSCTPTAPGHDKMLQIQDCTSKINPKLLRVLVLVTCHGGP